MVCALCALTVGAARRRRGRSRSRRRCSRAACTTRRRGSRADAEETERYIAPRLDALDARRARLRAELEALHARHELTRALGDADRLQWVIRNVRALESGDLFCWITGWTSDFDGARLGAALERSGARALLHFPPPAPRRQGAAAARQPAWARPFEIFSRALGMPSRNEADPSVLLALAVPLMFGYMFGDVGQGLVIAAAGFALRKRFPIARLFIAGGLAAAVFGLLFGSVFSMHDAFPPLWIEPLDDPLTILLVPLVGGAALLTVGLALNALEAWWRGELAAWLATDAGYVVRLPRHPRRASSIRRVRRGRRRARSRSASVTRCIARRAGAALAAIAELVERLAADPDQHAVVRARRRVRARARRTVVGDRRADGRAPTTSSRRRSCSSSATRSCSCSR